MLKPPRKKGAWNWPSVSLLEKPIELGEQQSKSPLLFVSRPEFSGASLGEAGDMAGGQERI